MISKILSIFVVFSLILAFQLKNLESILIYCIVAKFFLFTYYLTKNFHWKITPLLPNTIFLFFYFFFISFGEIVYLVRANILFNFPGSPAVVSRLLLIVFIVLTIINIGINYKFRYKKPQNVLKKILLRQRGYVLLIIIAVFGIYLISNGFSNIPIFADDIDTARGEVAVTKGTGFGFIFLLSGSIPFIYFFKSARNKLTLSTIIYLLVSYLPFILYGGRALMLLPIFLYVALNASTIKSYKKLLLTALPIVIVLFVLSSFFTIYRTFGERLDLTYSKHFNYVVSDLFPEYRTIVNVLHFKRDDYGDVFFRNLLSGQIPNYFYELFGKEKSDYYVSIGNIVRENSSYADLFDGGIRITLIGEMLVSRIYYLITSLIILQFIFFKALSTIYSNQLKIKDFSSLIFFYLLAFSFPYGINFVMVAIQFYLLILFLSPHIFRLNKEAELYVTNVH